MDTSMATVNGYYDQVVGGVVSGARVGCGELANRIDREQIMSASTFETVN